MRRAPSGCRFLLVCHPTRFKDWTTIPRARWISSAVFVVMTTVAIPSALRYRIVRKVEFVPPPPEGGRNVTSLDVILTPLWENDSFTRPYNWVQSFLRSIIPLLILMVMNYFIITAVRKTRANKKLASRNKITIMLVIVIIFFSIFITPDAVISAFFQKGYTETKDFRVKGVREITDCLLCVNASVNFFLYIVFNKQFRDQFLKTFCARCVTEREPEDPKYRRLAEASRNCPNGVGSASGSKKLQQTAL